MRAAQENRKFKVIILIPAIPGFAGDLRDSAAMGTRAIMDYQYKSICRGDHSIYGRIKAAGFDPTQYIFVFNLRSYDRLNKTPALKRQEEESGVSYQEVQRAQAEEVMSDAVHGSESFEGGGNAGVRETAKEGGIKGLFKKTRRTGIDYSKGGKIEPENPDDRPGVLKEKKEKFEAEREMEGEGEHSSDSIAADAMLGQKKPSEESYIGRDEKGNRVGTEDKDEDNRQQELENFVQEELYIHGKVRCNKTAGVEDPLTSFVIASDRRRPHRNMWVQQHQRSKSARFPRFRAEHRHGRHHSTPIQNGRRRIHRR